MFNLECKDVKLQKLTTRTEKHGHEEVPAASLTCEITLPNTVLDCFDSALLQAFYENKDNEDREQGELIEGDLRDYRFSKIKSIPWEDEYTGVRVKLINDLDHDEARFIFPECKIKSFKFEMKDGGSVLVGFTINCQPSGEEIGWLYDHQKKNVLMTIEPPEPQVLEGFEELEEE